MSKLKGRAGRPKKGQGALAALTFTVGEYSQKGSRMVGRLLNREWRQVTNIVKGIGDEIAAILISLNLYPLGLVNMERLEVLTSVGPRRPILLIHGYFHNTSSFYVLKRRLHREGWKHVYRINLKTYSMGVEECAQEVAKKVDAILEVTGAEKVDLIGHSFGGLCARYFVQAGGGAEKVAHVIAVGTPHGGTNLAGLGFGSANLDMRPESDVLHELNEDLPLPPNVEFTNIWSPFDYMVIPIENAIMEGRVRNIKIDHCGHQGLLYSRRVFNEIFLTLSSDTIHRRLAPRKRDETAGRTGSGVTEIPIASRS